MDKQQIISVLEYTISVLREEVPAEKVALSSEDVAARYGRAVSTVAYWRAKGLIPHLRGVIFLSDLEEMEADGIRPGTPEAREWIKNRPSPGGRPGGRV